MVNKKLDDDEVNIKFVKIQGNNKFGWPKKKTDIVLISDVLSVTAESTSARHLSLSGDDFQAVSILLMLESLK